MNLIGHRLALFGIQGSGKTTFIQQKILPNFSRYIVFDFMDDYKGYNRYVAKSPSEFDFFIDKVVVPNYQKIDLIVIDEANRLLPNRIEMVEGFKLLNDRCGVNHMNIGVITACRRPSQIHTDVVELAHYIICFGLYGKNDIQRLNAEKSGFGDVVAQLKNHEAVLYDKTSGEIKKIQ